MTINDITKTYAWQEALQLSKQLAKICEEFSDPDTNVLVWHLRQAVVDIPTSIATDLHAGRPATLEPAIKLVAALELVTKIYPAIETSGADEPLQQLLERMQSDDFSQREPNDEEAEAEVEPVDDIDSGASEDTVEESIDDDDSEVDEPAASAGSGTAAPKVDGVGRQRSR